MRDTIVCGYDWNRGTGPIERISLALARVGAKVLHCEPAVASVKKPDTRLRQVEPNIFVFKPWVYGYRLNRFSSLARFQGGLLARQILGQAQSLGFQRPLFIYANLGSFLPFVCKAMRERGCLLVHASPDYVENLSPLHVGQSDLTLVFSRTLYHRMRARWGEKIRYGFFGVDLGPFRNLHAEPQNPPEILSAIPRPRLGYAGGAAHEFLNIPVLAELLERRRDWSFISFQRNPESSAAIPAVSLSNAHTLPWQTPEQLARCVAGFDVGFMPYDCSNVVLFNNPPMKLWDYFALGMPVVATPMIHLWEYENLVYLGETAKELEAAVEKALGEPSGSPLRQKRKEVAEQHSAEAFGRLLEQILR